MNIPRVQTGLDRLLADGAPTLRGRRVGLLVHPASVDAGLGWAAPLLQAILGDGLRRLFGPQHGLRGETQDNMIEWEGFHDPATGLLVHSLYGEVRRPTVAMLDGLDTLVIDLQDVGARYYTFVWTVLLCLEACAEQGIAVVILDRPNPLGGTITEGNVLDPAYRSFVGLAPVPMRHGLTLGELALWLRAHFDLDLDLEVVAMAGWRRRLSFAETGLPWVLPSPNMPTVDTATVYPGFCLLEGTTLSEGRGTCRPFEIAGAPELDPHALASALAAMRVPGCVWRPLSFEPTFQKHAGRLCGGVQIHVTDRVRFRAVTAAVAFLTAARRVGPGLWDWRQPPYEYETERLPIDILGGGPAVREAVDQGVDPRELDAGWERERREFWSRTARFRLYE